MNILCCSFDDDGDGNCRIHSESNLLRPKVANLIATLSDIQLAEQALDALRSKYLIDHGWKRRCDTPGSYWVWHKEHFRRELMGSMASAISYEKNISGWEYRRKDEMSEAAEG